MPYFWHYRTPNPRDEILVDGRINIEYTRIERKPYVFLKDMVAPGERFTHPDWGSFSSFGWCSEREMAFACLLSLMGYTAHVIAPGAHAWTEVEIELYTVQGEAKAVLVSIDNTFNRVTYSLDPPSDHNNIYNTRAMASAEIARVRALTVTPQARARIDAAIDIYLDTK
jgi:hypothetical protein